MTTMSTEMDKKRGQYNLAFCLLPIFIFLPGLYPFIKSNKGLKNLCRIMCYAMCFILLRIVLCYGEFSV